MVLAALVAGFGAVALHNLPNQLGLIVAVFIGIGVGLFMEALSPNSVSEEEMPQPITSEEIPS